MRFAAAHKTTSYLAVGFALLAMIGGGTVSPLVSLVGVVGLCASWFFEPPRFQTDRWTWVFTVVAGLGFVYSGLMAFGTGDYLGHGGTFLIILTVARASTRRAAKDWQQLYLLAFLMIVAGTVLNGELSYAVCFLGFVVTSTWALILFHLRREMEDNFLLKHADPKASQRVEIRRILESRRIVDRRFLLGTGLTSLGFFVIAILFFLAIPRIGVGFFFRGKGGLNMVGFSDGVKLGGHGKLKGDPTIVMRVQLSEPQLRGRNAPYLYWRGVAFDHYARGEWTRTRNAPETGTHTENLGGNREGRYLSAGHIVGRDDDSFNMREVRRRAVRQEIWLDPLGTDALFAASTPVAFEVDAPLRGRAPTERNDEIRLRHDGPLHYLAWSRIEPPSAADLREATLGPPGTEPHDDVYLQLPPEITDATRALAREITAGATTDYDKAIALRDWLHHNLTYTLDLRDPGDREPIDFFLFERKAGHCEYFASAFAIMGRAVGLRTRSVNGFLGGEWNEYDGYLAVRAGDAHSWTEVQLGGDWITFDATPPGVADYLGRGGSGWQAKMRRWFDTLRFQWGKWVIDYDIYQQISLFRSIGKQFSGGAQSVTAAGRAIERWAKRNAYALVALVLVIGVAIALRRSRRRRRGGDTRAAISRERTELGQLYERAARRLAPRPPATTPRELARALVAKGAPGADQLDELTELYYAGQWGGAVDDAVLARARTLAAGIAQAAKQRR